MLEVLEGLSEPDSRRGRAGGGGYRTGGVSDVLDGGPGGGSYTPSRGFLVQAEEGGSRSNPARLLKYGFPGLGLRSVHGYGCTDVCHNFFKVLDQEERMSGPHGGGDEGRRASEESQWVRDMGHRLQKRWLQALWHQAGHRHR